VHRGLALVLLMLVAIAGWHALSKAGDQRNRVPTFQDDIRPVFQTKCWRCHDVKTHKAELNLTTLAGVLKGGESGRVIVPGKPDESLLYEKVHGGTMPPGKNRPRRC